MPPAMSTLIVIAIAALALFGMWRGWQARTRRTLADAPALPAIPEMLGEGLCEPVDATYVSTTTANDWLNRITAHGLGARSGAVVEVHPQGVLITRTGAGSVFLPANALRSVRLDSGQAGKFMGSASLVVITWVLGQEPLDTAVLPRHRDDRVALRDAIETLISTDHHHQEDAA